jgi:hypothetical protein
MNEGVPKANVNLDNNHTELHGPEEAAHSTILIISYNPRNVSISTPYHLFILPNLRLHTIFSILSLHSNSIPPPPARSPPNLRPNPRKTHKPLPTIFSEHRIRTYPPYKPSKAPWTLHSLLYISIQHIILGRLIINYILIFMYLCFTYYKHLLRLISVNLIHLQYMNKLKLRKLVLE